MIFRVSALLTFLLVLLALPTLATDPNDPEKDFQEDSLKNASNKQMLDVEDLEFMDGQEFAFDGELISEDLDEVEMDEDVESPVSFNVFYYLLEKFKLSNSTTSE